MKIAGKSFMGKGFLLSKKTQGCLVIYEEKQTLPNRTFFSPNFPFINSACHILTKKEREKERNIGYFLNTAYKNTNRFTGSAVSNYTDN
jgi:hypothetical protein